MAGRAALDRHASALHAERERAGAAIANSHDVMTTLLRTGISTQEAKDCFLKEDPNELSSSRPRTLWRIAWETAKEPMFLLLVSCATLYLVLGNLQESLMLGAAVLRRLALENWKGHDANALKAQQALSHRARCNQAARRGEHNPAMESGNRMEQEGRQAEVTSLQTLRF